ncbi:MAG: MFS transporter [Anaerolineales bacterium]
MLRRLYLPPSISSACIPNFINLYFDIGWFGILSGSSISFLSVYAARLGASGLQLGLLSSMAAAVSLFLAIPAGRWLEKQNINTAVFRASVWYRLGYLLWIPLPWLFNEQAQVWALIVIALLMAVPLTPFSVGFNALFAAAVPTEWRAHVAAVRNVVYAIAFILSSLGSGYLLEQLPFPVNYQVVFGIGFLGAAMSSLHLYFIKPLHMDSPPLRDSPAPAPVKKSESTPRPWHAALRLDIWKSPFGRVLLVFLGFHTAQYMALPLFTLYIVRSLHLSDDQIGLGTALFYLTVLVGSTQLDRIVRRFGHHKVTGVSVAGLAAYAFFLALSKTPHHYYATSLVGGLNYALLLGAYANYLLEEIPEHDRPAHLAWYNVILNASILIGSLTGPLIGNLTGIVEALLLVALLRFLSGLAILKWG